MSNIRPLLKIPSLAQQKQQTDGDFNLSLGVNEIFALLLY